MQAQAIIIYDHPVGITLRQTARLTFANIGEIRGFVVNWRFIDADGVIVARSERPLTIPFGKMASVDLDRDTLPQPEARVQIRAEVEAYTWQSRQRPLHQSRGIRQRHRQDDGFCYRHHLIQDNNGIRHSNRPSLQVGSCAEQRRKVEDQRFFVDYKEDTRNRCLAYRGMLARAEK